MSMILFACVVRVRDGLPLSASTDFYHTQDFLECRRRLKTLALRLAQYPGRGSAEGLAFSIHFSSSRDVACMAICSCQCPAAMAFCFLETLWWEFTASYDTTCIGLASRPYAFLEFGNTTGGAVTCHWRTALYDEISQQWKGPASVEVQHSGFSSLQSLGQGGRMAKPVSYSGADVSKLWAKDSVIQKVKWHFNYVSSTQMESSLEKIQEELKFQPPVLLTLEDADVANGVMNGHPQMHLEPAPNFRMEPVTALGILSLILNIMCAALNLIRGIHLAEHSLQVAQEEIGSILAFLIPFVACIFQCYLYLFYSPARTMKVVLMLLFICLGNMYLHGLRNLWQILFHIGVAFLSSYQILTRQPQEKQSDCGV
ncbi:vesicle-trafficking protein SEC22c isoform X1 [Balaenoptera acutorostrata]|uniref:Vesicle-trafficking protein SEC22c isoform X1 n=2 Tax=Balaenoptera acutorostrata TaxID=9767 RepID=A0A384B1C7_BALAC|nr:vesicle-trafficking protein SEC22c isoform X1 [Balaenoptera acutorostrata]XP_007193501.1 vesicle-trafficking protein SEC22c isoform X1 [Balaenoptera acutorostrata]XP_007193502.1 vesicle-trafficking protein SEC22c isoform X1 [Balaenoptera acutorostrata]XP_057410664.1 vesicle-trafficking protein SEC22c isoform X1 [Balaenoptera acutorostrata]XP_057410666.1 vesicle-trafficking protein SEC22c isoform X1 [Balaenoptera acutorostrata]XP_057410667.1 vesicle-trafficking protein SEC22c isoform X1 [Bal